MHPGHRRCGERAFPALQRNLGHQAGKCLAERRLAHAPPDLVLNRHAQGQVHHRIVLKRHPALHRCRHRHPVKPLIEVLAHPQNELCQAKARGQRTA